MMNGLNNIAIYTCITGGYDTPTDGFEQKEGYDYFLFSDIPIEVKSWKNMIMTFHNAESLSNVKRQRFVKTHPFVVLQDYDIVVWVDANTDISQKLYDYIEKNKDNSITFKNHPNRDCIYDEIRVCVAVRKENAIVGGCVMNKLLSEKYPHHNGLYETNIIISHPQDERVRELFVKWWNEIHTNSHRDQLSLNYVIWKNHLEDVVHAETTYDFNPKIHRRIITNKNN